MIRLVMENTKEDTFLTREDKIQRKNVDSVLFEQTNSLPYGGPIQVSCPEFPTFDIQAGFPRGERDVCSQEAPIDAYPPYAISLKMRNSVNI